MSSQIPQRKEYSTPWGSLDGQTIYKYLVLASVFFFTIACYWILRSVKDPIFAHVVGIEYQPIAKMVSVVCIFPILLIYSKLVDYVRKEILFYIFASAYALTFFLLSTQLYHLDQLTVDPLNPVGWISYVFIESFGSIMTTLFWGFVTGESTVDEGKKCFPIILFISQLGAVVGPTLVTYSESIGLATIIMLTSFAILAIPTLISFYRRHHFSRPKLAERDESKPHKKTGMFEGLRIILTNRYVLGVMGITILHEVVIVILDYQMKFIASTTFDSPEAFAVFMGRYGQAVNIGSYLWAMLGSSFLLRRLGMRFCLLLYPTVVLGIVIVLFFNPSLWFYFGGLVIYKMLNYGLNNPAKEVLYTPTDQDIRFKAKSWIDAFGARGAKATGSYVTLSFRSSIASLNYYGTLISIGVIAVWMASALYVSAKFKKLQAQVNEP